MTLVRLWLPVWTGGGCRCSIFLAPSSTGPSLGFQAHCWASDATLLYLYFICIYDISLPAILFVLTVFPPNSICSLHLCVHTSFSQYFSHASSIITAWLVLLLVRGQFDAQGLVLNIKTAFAYIEMAAASLFFDLIKKKISLENKKCCCYWRHYHIVDLHCKNNNCNFRVTG